jgi:hypothetical protein
LGQFLPIFFSPHLRYGNRPLSHGLPQPCGIVEADLSTGTSVPCVVGKSLPLHVYMPHVMQQGKAVQLLDLCVLCSMLNPFFYL